MVHAGKLYAMKEDSPCLLMDPLTLESEGYTDFGGKMKSQTFCAHPKIDPVTGNFCGFSYGAKGLFTTDMTYFEISPTGELLKEIEFKAPYYGMVHDFGMTEDYAVFPIMPLVSSLERNSEEPAVLRLRHDHARLCRRAAAQRDGRGSALLQGPEDGLRRPCHERVQRWHEGPYRPFGGGEQSFPFFPDIHGKPFDTEAANGYLTRWTVDMSSNSDEFEKIERLTGLIDEFPRIDDRYAANAYRHGWMLVFDKEKPYDGPGGAFYAVPNTLGYIDLATGKEKTWFAGSQSAIQEPCFVPRTPDSPEGDGYVVALVDNHVTNYSDLAVFDAQHIDEGPIARAKLPIRLRQGLHGNWADASKFATA